MKVVCNERHARIAGSLCLSGRTRGRRKKGVFISKLIEFSANRGYELVRQRWCSDRADIYPARTMVSKANVKPNCRPHEYGRPQ